MERVLVDSNILLRTTQSTHPQYEVASAALEVLLGRQFALVVARQNLVEFWAVATRPRERNGLGFSPVRAANEISKLRKALTSLEELPGTTDIWHNLVIRNSVSGKQAHDANLVATMMAHGVRCLLHSMAKISGDTERSRSFRPPLL